MPGNSARRYRDKPLPPLIFGSLRISKAKRSLNLIRVVLKTKSNAKISNLLSCFVRFVLAQLT